MEQKQTAGEIRGVGINGEEGGQAKPGDQKRFAPGEAQTSHDPDKCRQQEAVIEDRVQDESAEEVGRERPAAEDHNHVGKQVGRSGQVKALYIAAVQEVIAEMKAIQVVRVETVLAAHEEIDVQGERPDQEDTDAQHVPARQEDRQRFDRATHDPYRPLGERCLLPAALVSHPPSAGQARLPRGRRGQKLLSVSCGKASHRRSKTGWATNGPGRGFVPRHADASRDVLMRGGRVPHRRLGSVMPLTRRPCRRAFAAA